MSPIDPLGPLLAQIRAQASGLKRKEGAARSGPGDAARAGESAPPLMDRVVAGVASLSPELPDRRRRAFRLFLETVLANELAIQDPNAPTYQDLVDRVLASMEADGRLRRAIEEAGDALVGMSAAPLR